MDGPDDPEPNLYIASYEAWRAEAVARRDAEAVARLELRRGIRRMVAVLVAWSIAAGIAGAIALSRIARENPRDPASLPLGIGQGFVGSPTQPRSAPWTGA